MSVLPKTLVFWGAGATARLGMATTEQQGKLFIALSRKRDNESFHDCLKACKGMFDPHFETFCDLLELLDDASEEDWEDGFRISGFSKRQLQILGKYKNDLGSSLSQQKNRVIMMRLRYDFAAARRILRIQFAESEMHGVAAEAASMYFAEKIYSMIDANLAAGTGIHVHDRSHSSQSDFIDLVRLRAAKAALIMIVLLCFAASWDRVCTNDVGRIFAYRSFFKQLSRFRANEMVESRGVESVSNISVVSMNFDPIFWWFLKNADEEYNRQPVYGRRENKPIYLGEAIARVDAARAMKDGNKTIAGDLLSEDVAHFVNLHGDREAERCLAYYQTLKIFFPHGSPNIKICPSCGKTTLFQGNELRWNSQSLFPPFFMKDIAWGSSPVAQPEWSEQRTSESQKWKEGELDYIQCMHCGEGIRMCDTEILVQSGLKTAPSWILQSVAHDVDAEIMRARHIILIGYSLPSDDALWIARLKSRRQRGDGRVFCSFVGYEPNAKNHWLVGDELNPYLEDLDNSDKRDTIKTLAEIFGRNNIRANLKGFPDSISDEKSMKELFIPSCWDV